jgi:hypothetical protein
MSRPLPLSVVRGRPWRVAGLVLFLLSAAGGFALAAVRQPWRDVLGAALAAWTFGYVCAWTRWAGAGDNSQPSSMREV